MVHCCTFSCDGKLLASASQDKTACFWDVATGEELATLEGHKRAVYSCKFDSASDKVATGSLDKTIKLWRGETNTATLTGHTNAVCSVDLRHPRLRFWRQHHQTLGILNNNGYGVLITPMEFPRYSNSLNAIVYVYPTSE